jgi:hypothetical protein
VNGRVTFPTHAEAAYPEILCDRIASLLKQQLLNMGAIEVTDLTKQVHSQGKGATHFKDMMIPLFVLTRKKIVVTKLGWVFCFCDRFFHLTLKSVKRRNVKTRMFYF